MSSSVRLSQLDRSRTRAGEPDAAALRHTVERAGYADELGYHRFWVAEHHAVPGIASGSPARADRGRRRRDAAHPCGRPASSPRSNPVDAQRPLTPRQREVVERAVGRTVHGDEPTVAAALHDLLARTGADELLASTSTFDRGALRESDARLAELLGRVPRAGLGVLGPARRGGDDAAAPGPGRDPVAAGWPCSGPIGVKPPCCDPRGAATASGR